MNPYNSKKHFNKANNMFDSFDVNNTSSLNNIELNVTRETANISGVLPFILFGYQDLAAGYFNQLSRRLAAGVTTSVYSSRTARVAATIDADYNDILFKYTSGLNTDIVRVSCPNYPYGSLMEAIASNTFTIRQIRMSVSDPTLADSQFRNPFQIVRSSFFGGESLNSININASKRPQQFQDGIVDVQGMWAINKESMLIGSIIDTAAFSVSYNLFISQASKLV